MEQYKTDYEKNPGALLEATEILMQMLEDSRRSKAAKEKTEEPGSDIDRDHFKAELQKFNEIAKKYEDLESIHEDRTDEELAKNKKIHDMAHLDKSTDKEFGRSTDSHGAHGRG
jgi:hypothetical protein